ncbi:probable LRR receptor-like serine/threonine-protein kinase At3g47570 [Gastrolobium bilobum]|uniref:probable LRR receptor-like serine/threonine-protein kinase At3g47570 n=1 Tax=Gastrolobium bilobum TaxID=150636 RepID=UPI002AAFAE02|nr:probable LRR receptor-like serine/threonine-protein kinase At3g47570 [Gastrolobium bilobum]
MSSLVLISATKNQFNGSLPSNMFLTLPNLQAIAIGRNQISGTIPISIANTSVLQALDFGNNNFVGQVPSLGKLQDLLILRFTNNSLGDNLTTDLEFLKSLTNCSKLQWLDLADNNFGGRLPNCLGNLSSQLSKLYIGGNEISGQIPAELGNLYSLIVLGIENNHLEGIIPSAFGKFQNMQLLALSGNKLSGVIPFIIGNLSLLYHLGLDQNLLEGNIPLSIRNCQKLQYLDLSQNDLRGTIPLEVFSLSSLTNSLDLSHNSLSGSLPAEVGQLKNIDYLDVSKNHLSGNIPVTIGECSSLEYLYLQENSFHGIIPSSLASLKGLQKLDLSRNHLSGSIPDVLQNIHFLEYLNVSFNMLDGEVPTEGVFQYASKLAVIRNNNLCGGVLELHLSPCPVKGDKHVKHHNFKLIAVMISVVAFLLILSSMSTFYWMRKKNKKSSSDSPTIDQLAKVSYQNLHRGTDGFSIRNLIGSGSFGSVYKGIIEPEDTVVAIKVLNLQKKGAHKSFIAECNALKNIRHRNLVKILTCCFSTDFKGQEFQALVFEYMTNGSLESWLHPATEIVAQPRSLNLEERFNIINDVAYAIHYLHYECEQAIIHCDLKPGNVLLDDCLVAHVSDFGLARLLSSDGVSFMQSSTIGIKGTIGYAPPEYGMGSEVSTKGDMYSFGILILEMLTGKRPTDEMFKDGHTLHNYVKISLLNHLLQIVDQTILTVEENATKNKNLGLMHPNAENCLHSLFKIALACSVESPKERMSMIDVSKELNLIKSFFPSKI